MRTYSVPAVMFLVLSLAAFAQEGGGTDAGPAVDAAPSTTSAADTPTALFLVLESSLTWQGQSQDTTYSGTTSLTNGIEANPLFIMPGFSFRIPLAENQFLIAGMSIFLDEYVYREDLERAFPTQAETGGIVGPLATVLGIAPRAAWEYEFILSDKARLGLSAGLDLLLRLPVAQLDNTTGMEKIGTYLNRNLKFVYPELGIAGRFLLREGLHVGPYFRWLLPVYRLWDGENLPFWDTMFLSGGVFVELTL